MASTRIGQHPLYNDDLHDLCKYLERKVVLLPKTFSFVTYICDPTAAHCSRDLSKQFKKNLD